MARLATGPLHAEELGEVLIVDFDDAGRIQRPNTERCWHDQEQVVLSACSIPIDIVDDREFVLCNLLTSL